MNCNGRLRVVDCRIGLIEVNFNWY